MEKDFLDALEAIPWFANLGEPVPSSSKVRQITTWTQWPGPEDESVDEIASSHQSLYDSLFEDTRSRSLKAEEFWNRIHEVVFRLTTSRVPYDSTKDAWHAPSTAVWQAAWTAGLVGVCMFLQRQIPDELAEQWNWYKCGHWPCAVEEVGENKRLVIY